MINFLITLFTSIFLTITSCGFAQDSTPMPPQIKNFAFSMTLQTPSPNKALSNFDVPEHVYQNITSKDLNDIRVFNSDGKITPHHLSYPKIETSDSVEYLSVPLFPITTSTSVKSSQNSNINIIENSSGNIISVHLGDKSVDNTEGTLSYLVDLRKIDLQINSVKFNWTGAEGQIIPIKIEKSSNLKDWLMVSSGTLARLNFNGQVITQDNIPLKSASGNFLRITCNQMGVTFNQEVQIGYQKSQKILPSEVITQFSPITSSNDLNSIVFDTKGFFPVHAIDFESLVNNSVINVSISSKSTLNDSWTTRSNTTIYKITSDGTSIKNDSIRLPQLITDRYWKITPQNSEIQLPQNLTLKILWTAHRITYLIQNNQESTLAYGNIALKNTPSSNNSLNSLTKEDQSSIDSSRLTEPVQVLGNAALIPIPTTPPVQWKKWLLWGILISVLLIVLKMALSLSNELKT